MEGYTRFNKLYADVILGGHVGNDTGGDVFFVEGNTGNNTNDGKSWETAFKTLAPAFVASNASIAHADKTGYASRNKIYVKSDNNEANKETLITLPNKCDVIGVGSYDHRPYPVLIGNHVIGAAGYMGTRFINVGFMSLAAGGALFTVPETTSGLKLIGCFFDARTTVVATYGLVAVAPEQLEVIGCQFIGLFSAASIHIGAGEANGLLIKGNIIQSGAVGILVNSGLTCAEEVAMILNNVFDVVTLVIDENSDKVIVGGNRGRTQANGQVATTIDYNAVMAYDNIFAHSAGVSQYPVLVAIPAA